jgi:membrane protein implicated in regulation of membrane protease activity
MEWLRDHMWETWMVVAAVLAAAELVSLDLVLIMLAGGAVAGGLTAALGGPAFLQFLLAIVTAVGLLAVVRPSVAQRLHRGPTLRTGAEALIGQRAKALTEISHGEPGRVKLGGEEWSALPYDEDDRIEPGTAVDVVAIKGATAYVLRIHPIES